MAITKLREGPYEVDYLITGTAANNETAAVKVDKSGLTFGPHGSAEPSGLSIMKITYDVGQDTDILWDHTTDDLAVSLYAGQGCLDFTDVGGIHDPKSAGGTGDIVLTTNAGAGANEYSIKLELRKKQ